MKSDERTFASANASDTTDSLVRLFVAGEGNQSVCNHRAAWELDALTKIEARWFPWNKP